MSPEFLVSISPIGTFAFVFFAVGAISLLLLALFEMPAVQRVSKQFSEVTTAVVTVTGALLALSVTFLANSVWNSEDKARETVYAEARSIRVMETYMEAMTGPSRDGLARLIGDYAKAVKAEWPGMGEGGASGAEQALGSIYSAVLRGFGEGDANRVLQQRLLTALDTLSVARQQRLSMAQDVVSAGQWTLVSGLTVMLLLIVAISHAYYHVARRISLCVLSVALSIVLYVIVLHHSPFLGPYAQTPELILAAAGVEP